MGIDIRISNDWQRGEATEANFLGLAAGLQATCADRLYIPMCMLASRPVFDSASVP